MIKKCSFIVFLVLAIGCTDNKHNVEIKNLNNQVDSLISENEELRHSIELIRYSASDRIEQIKKLISSDSLSRAKDKIQVFQTLFPESSEMQECKRQEEIIKKREQKIKEEEDRIKSLGFKSLKESSSVEIFYNKVSIGQFTISREFTFDAYDDSWRLRTADRGNKYISARITITSTDKYPKLPVFYAYRVDGDKLICVGYFTLRFARWEDYATYLGNYNDNSNDFSKTASIPFKIGLEVSDKISSSPLVIICRKQNCMSRSYNRYENPPVSYSVDSSCTYGSTLTLSDLKKGYSVVKILNRGKL